MSEWKSTADVLSESVDEATPDQRVIMQQIYDTVDEWIAGDLSLTDADKATGDGWLRFQVVRHTEFGSYRFKQMMTFCSAIAADYAARHGDFFTKHGYISRTDIEYGRARFLDESDPETGEIRTVLQFPIKTPNDGSPLIFPAHIVKEQQPDALMESTFAASPFRKLWLSHEDHDDHADS